jgi:hypothetical protein
MAFKVLGPPAVLNKTRTYFERMVKGFVSVVLFRWFYFGGFVSVVVIACFLRATLLSNTNGRK